MTNKTEALKLALEALVWFIENDDTNIGQDGNEFWEDGLNRGIAAVTEIKEVLSLSEIAVDPVTGLITGRVWKNKALVQPEQEPVSIVVEAQYEDGSPAGKHLKWRGRNEANDFPEGTEFYTSPPKREPLTEEQKPVACNCRLKADECNGGAATFHPFQVGASCSTRPCERVYPPPPKREWVELTDEEVREPEFTCITRRQYARAVLAKSKEKNA